MNFPAEFIQQLKERAENRCECGRSGCHQSSERCFQPLIGEPGASRWSPIFTGESPSFPPVAVNYIALCSQCAKPRVAPTPPG